MLRKIQYYISEIAENYRRSTWWRNRFASHVVSPLQKQMYERNSSEDIVNESWDVLIILDGCRADLFEEVEDVDDYDEYQVKISKGGATSEWTLENFDGQAQTNINYVTGNPVVSKWVGTAFHKFVEVWRSDFDQDLGTVPAEAVTDAAIDTYESEPDKRLIVHYLQPHYPFINDPDLRFTRFEGTDEINAPESQTGASDIWEAVGLGLVDTEKAWDAYRRNLEYVLEAINPLLDSVSGRVVITSDHGNLIGEKLKPIPLKLYGHKPGIYHPALREVPWAVIEAETKQKDQTIDGDIEDKLRHLGYVG